MTALAISEFDIKIDKMPNFNTLVINSA